MMLPEGLRPEGTISLDEVLLRERNPRRKREIANQIVDQAKETIYWTGLTELMVTASLLKSNGSEIDGRIAGEMIRDLDTYFSKQQTVARVLVPEQTLDVERKQYQLSVNRLRAMVLGNEAVAAMIPPCMSELAEEIGMELARDSYSSDKFRVIPLSYGDNNLKESAIRKYNDTFLPTIYETITKGRATVSLPERTLQAAKEASGKEPGIFDIYTDRMNGVSLEKLEHEDNPDRFGQSVLTWIAGIPKGNLLWNMTVNGLFLHDIADLKDTASVSTLTNPDFSKKAYSFQWWVMQKLLVPAFVPQMSDKKFDKAFTYLLNEGSPVVTSVLASHILPNLVHADKAASLRDSRFAIDGSGECPVKRIALAEELDSPFYADEEMQELVRLKFLGYNGEKILDNLKKRFGRTKQYKSFEYWVTTGITDAGLFEEHNKRFIDALTVFTGEDLSHAIAELESRSSGSQSQSVSVSADYIDHEGFTECRIAIPSEFGESKLGMESISYTEGLKPNITGFKINFAFGKSLYGYITDNFEKITYLNINLTNHPALSEALQPFIENLFFAYKQLTNKSSTEFPAEQQREEKPTSQPHDETLFDANEQRAKVTTKTNLIDEEASEDAPLIDPNEILERLREELKRLESES